MAKVANRTRAARAAAGGRLPPPVIAIDGPAGAGKSTVARKTARALGIRHIDTGAMYRAITWVALDRGLDPSDGPALGRMVRSLRIGYGPRGVEIDGRPLGRRIRTPSVNGAVSAVSAHGSVRRELVRIQRAMVQEGPAVVEGRDIGTVVAPDAPVKVFLTASVAERARRRRLELQAAGHPTSLRALSREIARRDLLDSRRAISPLRPADDAAVIDSTHRTPAEVVAEIVEMVRSAQSRGRLPARLGVRGRSRAGRTTGRTSRTISRTRSARG